MINEFISLKKLEKWAKKFPSKDHEIFFTYNIEDSGKDLIRLDEIRINELRIADLRFKIKKVYSKDEFPGINDSEIVLGFANDKITKDHVIILDLLREVPMKAINDIELQPDGLYKQSFKMIELDPEGYIPKEYLARGSEILVIGKFYKEGDPMYA